MTGTELKKAVHATGLNLAVISERTGIPERTIFYLYKKEEVEAVWLEKFEKGGVNLYPVQTAFFAGPDGAMLRTMINTLQQAQTDLRGAYEALKAENATLRALITKGIERDHIFFDAVAAKIGKKELSKLLQKSE